jgi:protein ImuA
MPDTKQDILHALRRDILLLEGFRPQAAGALEVGLGAIGGAFPLGIFPTGAIHEFISSGMETAAASGGFVTGILGPLMGGGGVCDGGTRGGGACIWIRSAGQLFPPALAAFGIEPDRIIFIDLKREKDILWCMEEALACEGLAAVVGETPDIGFTASRRLQLAVEKSRVTAFLLRHNPRDLNTIGRVARWKITPLASEVEKGLPGIGVPRWQVELTWVKNGQPGVWVVEWRAGQFQIISDEPAAGVEGPELGGTAVPLPGGQRRRTG